MKDGFLKERNEKKNYIVAWYLPVAHAKAKQMKPIKCNAGKCSHRTHSAWAYSTNALGAHIVRSRVYSYTNLLICIANAISSILSVDSLSLSQLHVPIAQRKNWNHFFFHLFSTRSRSSLRLWPMSIENIQMSCSCNRKWNVRERVCVCARDADTFGVHSSELVTQQRCIAIQTDYALNEYARMMRMRSLDWSRRPRWIEWRMNAAVIDAILSFAHLNLVRCNSLCAAPLKINSIQ